MKRQQIRRLIIFISFFLFPLTYYFLSPYLIIWSASEGIINGSFLVFGTLFLSSLFFGRAFCGWICPASGFQQILGNVDNPTFVNGKKNLIKYVIWTPWILLIFVIVLNFGGYDTIDPMFQMIGTQDMGRLSILRYFIIYYIVLLGITILHFTAGQRGFCHTACWMAPFMTIGTKIRDFLGLPGFRLQAHSDKCVSCKRCNKECPMDLDVMNSVKTNNLSNLECILCLNCVDTCKIDAIKFHYGYLISRHEANPDLYLEAKS